MKKSERLLIRLRSELNLEIPKYAYIKRTYVGYWQKAAGAFLWIIYCADGLFLNPNIGSCQQVTDLLKCNRLSIYNHDSDIEIIGEIKS